ncbi:MAG: SDR family oxidoreductase [Planctomycetia bacterium]|nr:SDR family oxidoreductase [Planctomycetia bacterium]
MSKFLLTGGAGFIGSNLARRVLAAGHDVVVFDNFSTGFRENLAEIQSDLRLLEGDVRDIEAISAAADGCDGIFHLAALGSVPRSIDDPRSCMEINVLGTLNVLEAARKKNIPRVVYSASSSAYGNCPVSPKTESLLSCPLSPYACSKLAGEGLMQAWHTSYGLETISLRYFNVFGPRQNPRGDYAAVIPAFATALLNGHPPVVYGDGEQTRDFCFIDNVTSANLLAMAAPANECNGQPMNIACGCETSLNSMLTLLKRLLACEIRQVYKPPRPGDVAHSRADIRLAHDKIGYQPLVFFEQGLERTLDYYRAIAGK